MRTLLLTADHVPLKPISIEKALVQILKGIYYPVKIHPTRKYRSQKDEFPVPLAVAPFRHVPLPTHHFAPAQLNNQNLFLRDNYTCVYCKEQLTPGKLTRDHVYPQSLGGTNSWNNCVTSCQPCNTMKANAIHKTGPNGELFWDVNDPSTGQPVRMVLDFEPKAPSKLSMTYAKEVRRGVLDPRTLYHD